MVADVLAKVRLEGDDAVRRFTREFDGCEVERFLVPPEVVASAREAASPALIDALEAMADRLRETCKHQVIEPWMDRRAPIAAATALAGRPPSPAA